MIIGGKVVVIVVGVVVVVGVGVVVGLVVVVGAVVVVGVVVVGDVGLNSFKTVGKSLKITALS